ncbi:hypothetical protein [Stygiolobus azoricus]|uniref:hypothetical protein n=1 Tax=Stygiolobus azoricus TaxID=41675 RepID=UPI001E44CB2F|nr:hypothetical protein [Stygiolobus azoricus]
MMTELVITKDENIYRKLGAKAAMLGISVSDAILQAILLRLSVADSISESKLCLKLVRRQ